MQNRRRSPRAMVLRGRWFRPPRPRPIARLGTCDVHEEGREARGENDEEDAETEAGYDTCEETARGNKTEVLVASAWLIVESLKTTDPAAAEIVQALCHRLKKKEVQVEKEKQKKQEAKSSAVTQLRSKNDAQGQCGRYRWQVRKLQDEAKAQEKPRHKHRRPP